MTKERPNRQAIAHRERLEILCQRQPPRRRHPLDPLELEAGLSLMWIALCVVIGAAVGVLLAWGGPR